MSRHKDHLRGAEIQDGQSAHEFDGFVQCASEYPPVDIAKLLYNLVASMSILAILCHTSGDDIRVAPNWRNNVLSGWLPLLPP